MLRAADRGWPDAHDTVLHEGDGAVSAFAPATVPAPQPALAGSRYGADQQPRFGMAAIVLAIHAVAILALVYLGPTVVQEKLTRMQVFDVKLTPPPPPSEPAKTQKSEVVKLAPAVQAPQVPVVTVVPPPMLVVSVAEPVAAVAAPAPPAPAPAPAPAPTTVQGGDLGTQMMSGKPPRYPIESRRKREEGTVVLALVLGLDGRVESISISRSSGFVRLDEAARDAVRSWRWAPTIRGGQPVKVRGVVEIPFVLQT